MKFRGVMIGSENSEALGAFSTGVLGEPGFREGSWFEWDDGAQLIIGSQRGEGENALPQRITLAVEVNDVSGSFEKVKALGARVVAAPYKPEPSGENWLATLKDPDGNFIHSST